MSLNKKDKQFFVQYYQNYQNLLIKMSHIHLNTLLALTAVIISIYSIFLSITGLELNSALVGIFILGVMAIWWRWETQKFREAVDGAQRINKQIREFMEQLYPNDKKYL